MESSENTDDPVTSLMDIMLSIRDKEKSLLDSIRHHLQEQNDESRLSAKGLVQKLQFLQKLQQEAEAIEESLLEL